VVASKEHQVFRLKKSLYGLKKAPRQWYKKFESFMTELGYRKCNALPFAKGRTPVYLCHSLDQ
jgi:ATP-binding cassette subfamily B (MDR/TAP) protein 1